MDGQPYHGGRLFRLRVGADRPAILKTLSRLLDEGDTKPLEIEQLNFCLHLMMGKASLKMLEVYRFLAENAPAARPA